MGRILGIVIIPHPWRHRWVPLSLTGRRLVLLSPRVMIWLSVSFVRCWTGLCLLSLHSFIRAGKIPVDFLSRSFFSRCFVELHCLDRFVSSGLEVYLRTAVDDWIISSRTVLEWRSFLKVLRLFCFVCSELVSRSASRLIINYQHSTVYCGQ